MPAGDTPSSTAHLVGKNAIEFLGSLVLRDTQFMLQRKACIRYSSCRWEEPPSYVLEAQASLHAENRNLTCSTVAMTVFTRNKKKIVHLKNNEILQFKIFCKAIPAFYFFLYLQSNRGPFFSSPANSMAMLISHIRNKLWLIQIPGILPQLPGECSKVTLPDSFGNSGG